MPGKHKYPFFLALFLLFALKTEAQQINALCDSVFDAVKTQNAEKLRNQCPGYKDLKLVYDSSDLDMMNYQIGIRQKELEYLTSKDMKAMVKYAKAEKIRLHELEKTELKIDSQKTTEGQSYAHIRVDCEANAQPYIVHFVLIRLNETWFYGEGLRIEKVAIVKEETPNFEEIDRERERKRLEREKEKQRLVDAEKQRIEDSVKLQVKLEKERLKQEEIARKQKEKEEKEKRLQEEALRKEKEKEEKKKRQEEEALKKEKEKEQKELLRLEQEKKKEAELKAKEKEREKLQEEKERQAREKKELKEKEKKEQKRLKKEKEKLKEKEKKEKERLKKEEEKRREEERKQKEKEEKEKKSMR